ncbi:hypothetical protein VNO77_25317 [Canavalia gladiata]|uniref:Uncharacterized protein n=1 Tax=Canavalia gladiata TaxID=3824 RepID=A0AAN9LD24_CANGL
MPTPKACSKMGSEKKKWNALLGGSKKLDKLVVLLLLLLLLCLLWAFVTKLRSRFLNYYVLLFLVLRES